MYTMADGEEKSELLIRISVHFTTMNDCLISKVHFNTIYLDMSLNSSFFLSIMVFWGDKIVSCHRLELLYHIDFMWKFTVVAKRLS